MKNRIFVALTIFTALAMQACSNADASSGVSVKSETKVEKPKVAVYKVIANGETYKEIRSIETDSSGCISFHMPKKKGCGCSGGTPAKDVKICGSYLIEKTME
jgi:hypothetical protein